MTLKTYYLDTLVAGAGPGNHGADYAIFRNYDPIPSRIGQGEFKLYTIDWIKRGRPTEIVIDLPDVED